MKINIQEQLDRAIELIKRAQGNDLNVAEDIVNGLLNQERESPAILAVLGTVYIRKHYYALARYVLELAGEIYPNDPLIWNNLGFIYKREGRLEEARKAHEKAHAISPNDPDILVNLGGIHAANGTPEKAIEYLDKCIALDANNPHAIYNRGLAYLEQGNYALGFEGYDAGIRTTDRQERTYSNKPKWDGKKGQTIVVYGEQGIGDEIMFASMLPDVMKDCTVILDAHPRLYEIFRHSFPDICIYGTRKDEHLNWPSYHAIDARIAIGTLGRFYRKQASDFPGAPYLKADPIIAEKYRQKLARMSQRMKIGISWRGGIKQTNGAERVIPLEQWLPLFQSVDADFISLQYDEDAAEVIAEFTKKHGIVLHHWQGVVDDYDETAGLVSQLNMVISVPQSVVHLAGALGTPTIQLTPKRALWQMGVYGENMPWYSCVKNIWQDDTRSWEPVIQQAKDDVCNLYQMNMCA